MGEASRQKVLEKAEQAAQLAPRFHSWLHHLLLRFIFISSGGDLAAPSTLGLWPQYGCSPQGGPWDPEFTEKEQMEMGYPELVTALAWGPKQGTSSCSVLTPTLLDFFMVL